MACRICLVAALGMVILVTPSRAATQPPAVCAIAKTAAECADILTKLGKNPFDAFGYPGNETVYGGTPAPPCKNGEATCEPWERDWRSTPLALGSVVTSQGVVYAPPANSIVDFLYNWQTLSAGVLAIVAALIGAVAAYRIGNAQIRAARRRDRLQARGIVVGVYPELLSVQVQKKRAVGIITEQFPRIAGCMTAEIVVVIQSAQIDVPPLLSRNVDNFFLVEPGSASLLQVVSFTMQLNDLVNTLARQIAQNFDNFDPPRIIRIWRDT